MGFRPRPTPRLAPFAGRTPARLRSRRRFEKALVTGAAGGLGIELCRLPAEDETSLVLLDRDAEGLLASSRSELGDGWTWRRTSVDFADLEAVDAAAAELVADHPDIDLLIAGAGLDRAQSLLAFDWRQARDDFTVNALSNLVLLSHLAPAMARRGGGHVTAIVSLAGLVGMPYEAPYSGSKAALAAIADPPGPSSSRGDHVHRGLPGLRGHADVPSQRLQETDPTSQSLAFAPRQHPLPHRPPGRRRADLHGDPEAPREPRLPGPRARQAAAGAAASGAPARPLTRRRSTRRPIRAWRHLSRRPPPVQRY